MMDEGASSSSMDAMVAIAGGDQGWGESMSSGSAILWQISCINDPSDGIFPSNEPPRKSTGKSWRRDETQERSSSQEGISSISDSCSEREAASLDEPDGDERDSEE
jgi:hypothetical protein